MLSAVYRWRQVVHKVPCVIHDDRCARVTEVERVCVCRMCLPTARDEDSVAPSAFRLALSGILFRVYHCLFHLQCTMLVMFVCPVFVLRSFASTSNQTRQTGRVLCVRLFTRTTYRFVTRLHTGRLSYLRFMRRSMTETEEKCIKTITCSCVRRRAGLRARIVLRSEANSKADAVGRLPLSNDEHFELTLVHALSARETLAVMTTEKSGR